METTDYYYNKGHQDAVTHHYQPPHGLSDTISTWTKKESGRMQEENMAYEKGYFYSRGEEDAKLNTYEPPEHEEHKIAYDMGYHEEFELHH